MAHACRHLFGYGPNSASYQSQFRFSQFPPMSAPFVTPYLLSATNQFHASALRDPLLISATTTQSQSPFMSRLPPRGECATCLKCGGFFCQVSNQVPILPAFSVFEKMIQYVSHSIATSQSTQPCCVSGKIAAVLPSGGPEERSELLEKELLMAYEPRLS